MKNIIWIAYLASAASVVLVLIAALFGIGI
jgi:hypothetical protein